jgi:hypothetical protein
LPGVKHPFGVTKEGYKPHFVLDMPVASDDTVYVANVALQKSAAHGAIRGRVRHLGRDLRNIPVGLDYSTLPIDSVLDNVAKKGETAHYTSLLGSAVRTDATGRFAIDDLAPGTYYVDVAFLPDDGYTMEPEAESREILVEVGENETVDIGTVRVVKSISPLWPAPGATINDATPLLHWTSVPEADFYRISIGFSHILPFTYDVTDPSYQVPLGMRAGSRVRWSVTARKGGETLASFEAVSTFTIAP